VGGVRGVLESAGLLFFAFAGYARIATLGEEVRDPRRTIPRAIPIALGITLVIYLAVAVVAVLSVGPDTLAASAAPLADVVRSTGADWAVPVVSVGAAVGSLGVLLSLLVGVSRTSFAMAAERDLPGWLDAVHPERAVPHRAELVVGLVVVVVVSVADLRGAIGFSSFAVLTYYAIANASAWTLAPDERRWPRPIAGLGLVGCVVVAVALPIASVIGGAALLAAGVAVWAVRRRLQRT
jgi:APA family basic amino acid/polyamine antiporter